MATLVKDYAELLIKFRLRLFEVVLCWIGSCSVALSLSNYNKCGAIWGDEDLARTLPILLVLGSICSPLAVSYWTLLQIFCGRHHKLYSSICILMHTMVVRNIENGFITIHCNLASGWWIAWHEIVINQAVGKIFYCIIFFHSEVHCIPAAYARYEVCIQCRSNTLPFCSAKLLLLLRAMEDSMHACVFARA